MSAMDTKGGKHAAEQGESDTVLVTGAGGFVGSAVVRLLVRTLHGGALAFADGAPVRQVVALIRPGGSRERLQEIAGLQGWSVESADLAASSQLRDVLYRTRPRVIMHLGLDGRLQRDLPEAERHRVNVGPIETLFAGLAGVPRARLIHTGSAWVLPSGSRLAEDSPLQPWSTFTANKARLDEVLPALGEKADVRWINLRLFNIFGKHEAATRLLPSLVARLTRDQDMEISYGDQVRDFNEVDDMALAYLRALQADDSSCNQLYHIGSGRGTSVRDFALAVAQTTGNAHRIHFGSRQTTDQALRELVADPVLAEHRLGWKPAAALESRILIATQWWMKHTASSPRSQLS